MDVTGIGDRRRWARRTVLGFGLAGVAGLLGAPTAQAVPVTLGRFGFAVQTSIREQQPSDGWQWQGQLTEHGAPAILVLARADLVGTEPREVLGLLLASGIGGWLPELSAGPARDRLTQDGSPAVRSAISFRAASRTGYRGTMLITSNGGSTAVLAVLGTDRLTAGRIAEILDSARWAA